VSVYLDASVLVALFTDDPFTERAYLALESVPALLFVSDLAAAEFSSTIARQVRMKRVSTSDAHAAFSTFDEWTSRASQRVQMTGGDVTRADAFLRRLDLPLRAPDAIHIAISQRVADSLLTFDKRMAASARSLGTRLAAG